MKAYKNILVQRIHRPPGEDADFATAAEKVRISMPAKSTPLTVGVWNLGDWLGSLPDWLQALNNSQEVFRFFPVQAMVPLGLIREPEGVAEWMEVQLGRKVSSRERKALAPHTIEEEFCRAADQVRREVSIALPGGATKLDILVGITPALVAFKASNGDCALNYFSGGEGPLVLASTHELREFARQSKIPFSRFAMTVMVAQILQSHFAKPATFHSPNRRCIFDFNEERHTIKKSVGKLCGKRDCLDSYEQPYRDAARALVAAINQLP